MDEHIPKMLEIMKGISEDNDWLGRTDLVLVASQKVPFRNIGRTRMANETLDLAISRGEVEQDKRRVGGARSKLKIVVRRSRA